MTLAQVSLYARAFFFGMLQQVFSLEGLLYALTGAMIATFWPQATFLICPIAFVVSLTTKYVQLKVTDKL